MTDQEDFQLSADEFTVADQAEMSGLHCGDEPWSRAATEWIQGSSVLDSIEKQKTKVWIFRDAQDAIVGFASMNQTGWKRWPPPDGPRSRLLYIPQLGIDKQFHGKPDDPDWRYSNQILNHLIFEAQEAAKEIKETKKPKKHVEQIFLHVHKDNVAAQKVYQRFDFELLEGFESNDHILMSHKLNLSE